MAKRSKGESAGVIRRMLSYTRPHAKFLALSLVCAAAGVALSLFIPVLIGEGVDLVVAPGMVDFERLPKIVLLLALAAAGSALFQWLTSYFNSVITFRTAKDLRGRAFGKLSAVPLSYIDGTAHGDIISRIINDVDAVSDGMLQAFTQLFTGVLTIVGTLAFMLAASPLITLVVAVLTPMSLFVAAFIVKGSYRHFSLQSAAQGDISGYINEYVTNQKLVLAFDYTERAQEGFEALNARLYKSGFMAQFFSALTNPSTRFVNSIVYAAVGVIGALGAIAGSFSVGRISMFLSYANQYTKPFNEISGIVTMLQTAAASAKRIFDIIDSPEEVPEKSGSATEKPETSGLVELRDVTFSYTKDRPLIEGLNLTAPPGTRVAIVGPTGCGKTTLINLLMRFYEINSGTILLDGTDITEYSRAALRRSFGMVLQDSWLFNGTVRDNIAYALDASKYPPGELDRLVKNAAGRAQAHEFIERLPDGYDTVISGDGGSLSQGQRQLLCIARVILLDAPIMILDEATSNIDTRTEIAVQRAVNAMMAGRTSFVVAHRLSTIREADCIVVMDSGRIVESGKHGELLKSGGYYADLYRAMVN